MLPKNILKQRDLFIGEAGPIQCRLRVVATHMEDQRLAQERHGLYLHDWRV